MELPLDMTSALRSVDHLHLISQSLILSMVLILFRVFVERRIHQHYSDWTEEQRLKSIGFLRNTIFALLFFGLIYIWGSVLRDFAVSVFAIALACVVATKELILCVHGYLLILRGSFYHLGDRIEINGKRGDVTNITVLSTTLLEVGPMHSGHQRTGRQISFPNSTVLNHFVHNESIFEQFALITISVPLHLHDDWEGARKKLLGHAQDACASYLDAARKKIAQAQRRAGVELPIVDPRVHIDLTGPQNLALQLRLPCPFHLRERIEQRILCAFLRDLVVLRHAAKEEAKGQEELQGKERSYPEDAAVSSQRATDRLGEGALSIHRASAGQKIPIIEA